METKKRIQVFLIIGMLAFIFGRHSNAWGQGSEANVDISYLPHDLVAAARNGMDIPVELELIFMETAGVSVNFDQIKKTFTTSGGSVIEDPISFVNLHLSAGMESHTDTTLVIPANVAMLCLGAGISCDITASLYYTGLDSQGNNISASIDVPIKLTTASAAETFAVGEIKITSPIAETMVNPTETKASANISVTGVGSISGQWLVNGKPIKSFSRDVIGEGTISVSTKLPPDLGGKSIIQVRITQPEVKLSNEIVFVAETKKPVTNVDSFHAGLFEIREVTSEPGKLPGSRSGTGIAVFKPLGIEIEVRFENLYIIANGIETKLVAGQIITDVNNTIERGPLKVKMNTILITSESAWADGYASLDPSGLSDGIGPLYFYALPFSEEGLAGGTKLETPQKGEKGEYKATVNEFELALHQSVASLEVSGNIQKPSEPDWSMPLRISVSLGDNGE